MAELVLKYPNGQMTINLEAFLECRRIGKVKKLLKLADTSHNADVRDELKKHIVERIPLLEASAKLTVNEYVNISTRIKEQKYEMDYVPKKSTRWKQLQMEVKQNTTDMNRAKRTATNDTRNLQFYKKVLELFE